MPTGKLTEIEALAEGISPNPAVVSVFDDRRFHLRIPNYEAQRLRSCFSSYEQYTESLPDLARKQEDSQRLRMQLTPLMRKQFVQLTQDDKLKFVCNVLPDFKDAISLWGK